MAPSRRREQHEGEGHQMRHPMHGGTPVFQRWWAHGARGRREFEAILGPRARGGEQCNKNGTQQHALQQLLVPHLAPTANRQTSQPTPAYRSRSGRFKSTAYTGAVDPLLTCCTVMCGRVSVTLLSRGPKCQ